MNPSSPYGHPDYQGPPPQAPPSYSQAMGGVPSGPPHSDPSKVQQQTIVTTVIPLGPGTSRTVCPLCNNLIHTVTKTEPGLIAYISGVVIALLGCWLGCCLIPCCIDECMDVHHNCPSCGAYLGRYRR